MQWCWAGGAGLAVVVAVLVRMAYASKYNDDIDRMCGGLILTVLILAAAVAAGWRLREVPEVITMLMVSTMIMLMVMLVTTRLDMFDVCLHLEVVSPTPNVR